ncbi:hypothetical protein [Citrobacter phage Ci1]|nr:hypothetical protein [Citrobacter phage Ci1]
MENPEAHELWTSGKMSRSDFELNCLFNVCGKHRVKFPETEENFEVLFERIILKLADMEVLSEHEWESIQRLYSIHFGTILLEDIYEAFGYKIDEALE